MKLLLSVVFLLSLVGQPSSAQRIVDGAFEPDSIPDVIAYQILFATLNPAKNETPKEYEARTSEYLSQLGLPDQYVDQLLRAARHHDALMRQVANRERQQGLPFATLYRERDLATWRVVDQFLIQGMHKSEFEKVAQHLISIKTNTQMQEVPGHDHTRR